MDITQQLKGENLPTNLKDPFKQEGVESIRIWYRKNIFANSFEVELSDEVLDYINIEDAKKALKESSTLELLES